MFKLLINEEALEEFLREYLLHELAPSSKTNDDSTKDEPVIRVEYPYPDLTQTPAPSTRASSTWVDAGAAQAAVDLVRDMPVLLHSLLMSILPYYASVGAYSMVARKREARRNGAKMEFVITPSSPQILNEMRSDTEFRDAIENSEVDLTVRDLRELPARAMATAFDVILPRIAAGRPLQRSASYAADLRDELRSAFAEVKADLLLRKLPHTKKDVEAAMTKGRWGPKGESLGAATISRILNPRRKR
jgi:hypothetical protein